MKLFVRVLSQLLRPKTPRASWSAKAKSSCSTSPTSKFNPISNGVSGSYEHWSNSSYLNLWHLWRRDVLPAFLDHLLCKTLNLRSSSKSFRLLGKKSAKTRSPKWSKSDHWSCSLAFSWLTIQPHVQKWHILKIAPCNPRGTRITFCPGCDSDLTWQHSHKAREAKLKVRMHSQNARHGKTW